MGQHICGVNWPNSLPFEHYRICLVVPGGGGRGLFFRTCQGQVRKGGIFLRKTGEGGIAKQKCKQVGQWENSQLLHHEIKHALLTRIDP